MFNLSTPHHLRRPWPAPAFVLAALVAWPWTVSPWAGAARAASLPRPPVQAARDTVSIESLIGPSSPRFT